MLPAVAPISPINPFDIPLAPVTPSFSIHPSAVVNDALILYLHSLGKNILSFWWLWLFLFLWMVFISLWKRYRRNLYLIRKYSVLLEVKIPREIIKGARAMEQIFANLSGLVNSADNPIELYWDGEITHWFGFEIASFNGDIHFYIWTPRHHQSMVEAHIYAQYPDVEINEVSDYTEEFPKTLKGIYNMGYDLYGTELVMGVDDVYPIRTYTQFESPEEEQNLDPISALIENMAGLKQGERLWMQVLIRPASGNWAKKGRKIVDKLKNKAMMNVQRMVAVEGETFQHMMMQRLSPGEIEIMESIEKNISKPAFETIVRYMYLSPKKIFNLNFGKRAIFSSINQYKSPTLNYFKNNTPVRTIVYWSMPPFLFPNKRLNVRKEIMLINYRKRYMPDDQLTGKLLTSSILHLNIYTRPFVMSTEELATIYHYPSTAVLTSPFIKRVESKKIGPPAGLPIFSDEESPDALFNK